MIDSPQSGSGTGELAVKRFGPALAGTLVSTSQAGRPVVFTRLRGNPQFALGDISPEDAFSMHVNCIDLGILNIKRSGTLIERHHIPLLGATIYDLSDMRPMSMESRFDTVRFLFPRDSLQDAARDLGSRGQVRLVHPAVGFDDPVIAYLTRMLGVLFAEPERASQLVVDQLGLATQAHLVEHYSEAGIVGRSRTGGLSAWQERRAKELIDANLSSISLEYVASECGLSTSHFARAFRQTTGLPPYRWLSERRLDKVIALLSEGKQSLSDIAAMCGFADQSHMGRAFVRRTGVSPGQWRKRDAS